jgi:hypothetical protein
MLFLIEYDRAAGRLTEFRCFQNSEEAQTARINLELKLNQRGIEREVVLLEAETEEDLRRTHRRYFEGLLELSTPVPVKEP